MNPIQAKNRKVGVLLGIGILLAPYIFSWFTLRKGHTTLSRVISFIWFGIAIVILLVNSKENAGSNVRRSGNTQKASYALNDREKSVLKNVVERWPGSFEQ